MDQLAKNSTPEPVPTATTIAEFDVSPSLFPFGFKWLPGIGVPVACHRFDVFVHLATANISNLKSLTELENLLIEKATVHPNDDRCVEAVMFECISSKNSLQAV
jgi:hypothetical protein